MLRFSIRDLFWLTVVVAVSAGWWRDRATPADVRDWWAEHVSRYHATNPNDYKRLLQREGPPRGFCAR